MLHQSQSNLPLCDNDTSLLANVSGHSSCKDEQNNNNSNDQCCADDATKRTNLYPLQSNQDNCNNNNNDNTLSVNNRFNFSRVSLKTIKNKIKLNASYSLTLLQQSASACDSKRTVVDCSDVNNSNDTIIYNSNSIDNNKSLIKSKSITGCMNDDTVIVDNNNVELIDELPMGDCGDKVNSISPDGNRLNEVASSNIRSEIKSANDGVIPSSCSSTSNENNNEVVGTTNDSGSDERKLLNVNSKRNTNPFLNENGEGKCQHFIDNGALSSTNKDDGNTQSSGNATSASTVENVKLKNLSEKIPHGSMDYHDRNLLDDDIDNEFENDSDEQFCNSEIFGVRESEKHVRRKKKTAKSDRILRQKEPVTNECEMPSSMGLINNIDPLDYRIKKSIPTCTFQRVDYRKPGEENPSEKRDKKFLKLSKKSSHLFNIASFGKVSNGRMTSTMTPSLKHVNLHYPNMTTNTQSLDAAASDKKYLTKAKYQLIKLGQKCKILTHHPSSTTSTLPTHARNVRTTIINTNSNHRKKYQYYNEINKSYQLDDFIRSTHLLKSNNGAIENSSALSQNYIDDEHLNTTLANNVENYNCNSVIYKSYKSEIDLTRNLTYLDAFLNEHFERESTSTMSRGETNARERQHHLRQTHGKRVKASKNINYSTMNVEQQHQPKAMINDAIFDGIDESIDDGDFRDEEGHKQRQQQFYDGNVTSSSFEYTSATKTNMTGKEINGKKTRKDVQEIISGKSNTTSSSMSSSDYASVYSGGSKEGRSHSNDAKTKLISTPEESIEYYDTNVMRQHKQKRLRSGRRSSQPIPELTNSCQENERENFLLFDQANFIELKNNMKKFHPDLYNSVPQFEDLNSIDFYENPQFPLDYFDDGDEGGETLINPYARMEASPTNKGHIDDRGFHHQDYLEHFQQQLLNHDDIEVNDYAMKNHPSFLMSSNFRPRAMTSSLVNPHSNYNEKSSLATREVYYNPAASTNDLHDGAGGRANGKYSYPHRVIVSKSKKQKGEVVLEYEC